MLFTFLFPHADDLALLYESWWKTRRSVVYTLAPGKREQGKTVLFDRCASSSWLRCMVTMLATPQHIAG
jgi:hypothetical protein